MPRGKTSAKTKATPQRRIQKRISRSATAGSVRIDWDSLSIEAIDALIVAAEEAKQVRRQNAEAALRAEFASKAAAYGLTLADLVQVGSARGARAGATPGPGKRGKQGPRGPAPIKFRGPNGETWSGRGLTPRWLKALEARGKKRDQFAV